MQCGISVQLVPQCCSSVLVGAVYCLLIELGRALGPRHIQKLLVREERHSALATPSAESIFSPAKADIVSPSQEEREVSSVNTTLSPAGLPNSSSTAMHVVRPWGILSLWLLSSIITL